MGGYLIGLILGILIGCWVGALTLDSVKEDYIKDCEQFGKVRIHETVLECRKVQDD